MKDEEYERIRDTIRGYIDKWVPRMGLGWWRLDVDYSDEPKESQDSTWAAAADTFVTPEYRRAHIVVYVPTIARHWKRDQYEFEIVVHELAHVLVGGLAAAKKYNETAHSDAVELTTETIARAFDYTEMAITEAFTGAGISLDDKPDHSVDNGG